MVYADVLIFLNGIITYFLLLCVCAFFKFRPKTYRLILGALSGGMSALTIFLPSLNFFMELLIRTAVCAIIVFITFSFKNKIRFLKYSLAFLTVTYIFGGAMLAIFEIASPSSLLIANGVTYFDIEPMMLILSTAVIYLFIRFLMLFKKNTTDEEIICNCIIEYDGIRIAFQGVNDTGNSLTDPYFGSKVVIIEKSVLKPILELNPKTYLIPIKSVVADGMIFAFRPSAFFIEKNGKNIRKNDITVAISETKLHKQYNGILSPEIIDIGEEELCLTK